MEQPNDATASPPLSAATKKPQVPAQQIGKTKGDKSGHHTPRSPRRKLQRGIRSPNAADASPARSARHSSRSRSPALSSSGSPAASPSPSLTAASGSGASPLPSPKFKKTLARRERKAVSSPSRSRSRTPTVGLSNATPSSAERMPRTLQSSPRPVKIGTVGGRPIIAPADHKAASTAKGADQGGILPKDTSGTPAVGTAAPAAAAERGQAVQGRNAGNVLAALKRRFSTATGEFRSRAGSRPSAVCRSPGTGKPVLNYYDPITGTPTALASTVIGKERTLLKSELIVGFVSCLLLVFLLVFAVTKIALAPSSSTINLCVTHACRAYSRRLSSSINQSVNPCVSFTHFVCDGWQRRQNLDVWEERFLLFMNRLHTTLSNIHVPAKGQNDEQRAAALYRSCYDVFQGKSDELASVKEALATAGIIWPLPSKGADALFAMLYSSLKLGWEAVLWFRVAPRPGEPVDELVVSQGRSFDTLREWYAQERATTVQHAHFEFIRSQFAAGENGTIIGNAVTYNQTWDIAAPAMDALLPFIGVSQAALKPADWFANSSSTGLTEARWIETLHRVNVSVVDGLRIFSDDRGFLGTLLALWEKYGEDRFHLFVSWCTVQVAALYANRGLILNYYGQIPDRAKLYYRAFCVSKALFFSPSLIARYSGNDFHSKAGAVAKKMVLSIRLAFSRRLSKWSHYNPNVTVVANWNSLDSAFRDFEYDEGRTDHRATNDVPDMTDSFVANWQHSVFLNNTREVAELSYAVRHLWLQSTSWGEQDFHLMPYTLSFPFFDSKLPTSINFGGFGSEVVAALGTILVGSYQAYSNATDYLFRCLMRGPSGKEEYSKEDVAGAIGYSALVDAFRQASRTAWVLEGLEKYSDMQLLFLSSCFVLCPGSHRGQEDECNIFAQHVPEFAEAFQCSQEAEGVNASERCQPL